MRTLSRIVKCAPGEVENEDGGWRDGPGTALHEDPTRGTRWGASTGCRAKNTKGSAAYRWVSIIIIHKKKNLLTRIRHSNIYAAVYNPFGATCEK